MRVPTPPDADDRVDDDAWSTLFDLLPIGAYRSRPDGAMVRANRALVRLNGYASEAELLAAVADIGGEWYAEPARRDEFRRLIAATGAVRGFESEVRRLRTGERMWVREHAHLVQDAEGRVRWFEGTVEEVTDRVLLERALVHSDAQLRSISSHFPGVVFRSLEPPAGPPQFLYVSDGVREVYGIEPDALLRDGLLLQRMRHPDDDRQVQRAKALAWQHHEPHTAEFRIVRADGGVRWVHATANVVSQGDDGDVRTGVILDVTARHEADALRAERDRADAARRASKAMLSRVSHELRTPLNAVLGFGQLMQQHPALPPALKPWCDQLVASGGHLLTLVGDVLALASAGSGEQRLQADPVDPRAVAAASWAMVAADAEARGIVLELPAALPRVRADEARLRQILTNLLSNAVKYNRPHGRVRIDATADAGTVVLSVDDDGPGLRPDQLARAFLPFERFDAEQRGIAGTGLGLALARELAQAMGGELDATSPPGRGATFLLRLPAA